jgi:hypothetical protein
MIWATKAYLCVSSDLSFITRYVDVCNGVDVTYG